MMRNKIFTIVMAVLVCVTITAYAAVVEPLPNVALATMESNLVEEQVDSETPSKENKSDIMADILLQSEKNIQYYAHMDLETADESLQPIILAAREKIVFRQDWVADDVDGYVVDKSGNIIEDVPHFSELFPADWEVPTIPTEIDSSYYGR